MINHNYKLHFVRSYDMRNLATIMRIWTLQLTVPQSLVVIKITLGQQIAESAGDYIEIVRVTHSPVARDRIQVGKDQLSLLTIN